MDHKRFKAAALVLAAWVIQSCGQATAPTEEDSSVEKPAEISLDRMIRGGDVEVVEIDGCEYLFYHDRAQANLGFGFMAHKGNCKNHIHIYQQGGE